MEHNSVLRPVYLAHETIGCDYTIVRAGKTGLIDYEELEKAIKPNTKMIAITHGSNVTGNIVDLEKVAAICKKHNIISVVDANTMQPVHEITSPVLVAIAVYIGSTRLIDNFSFDAN